MAMKMNQVQEDTTQHRNADDNKELVETQGPQKEETAELSIATGTVNIENLNMT